MDERKVKNSFARIREDIDVLKQELKEIRDNLYFLSKDLKENSSFYAEEEQTDRQYFSTDLSRDSTDNSVLEPLNGQNLGISTGNIGVPTDRQTDRQTDKRAEVYEEINYSTMDNALEILDSLDSIKKELRLKFKRLTEKEFLVFSTIYGLEETGVNIDYRIISEKLSLTESSIRDYVGKLIKKGVPIEKKKLNNKHIILSISPSLKKLAPLSIIMQLRDI